MSGNYTYLNRADWPLLLVGPIVRKVTPTSVAVFVVTSRPCEVVLELVDPAQAFETLPNSSDPETGVSGPTITHSTVSQTRAIGEHCHVLVIQANGLSLTSGVAYPYNMRFKEEAVGPGDDFQALGLLSESREAPLGYAADTLPTFVLPQALPHLRFIHQSCRKAHGVDPDMLPTVDKLIQDNLENMEKRPQQLLLTGDQIYADDVAAGYLHNLTQIGSELMGPDIEEVIEFQGEDHGIDSDIFKPGARGHYLDADGLKVATVYTRSHLLFFQEWVAMYVMAWSDALWMEVPESETWALQAAWDALLEQPGNEDLKDARYAMTPSAVVDPEGDETSATVIRFAHNIQYVRRALANIPTYMIFDDHEITDDWFVSGLMDNRLRQTTSGHRILRNGLSAYAIFQDWGNQPEQYAIGLGLDFWNRVQLGGAAAGAFDDLGDHPLFLDEPRCLDTLLNVGLTAIEPAAAHTRLRFDYEIVGPSHRIKVLDTRTWRRFPDGDFAAYDRAVSDATGWMAELLADPAFESELKEKLGNGFEKLNAELISSEGQALQLADLLADPQVDKLRFVVSPSPVFGVSLIEMLQRIGVLSVDLMAGEGDENGTNNGDNEPWMGNPTAFAGLLSRLGSNAPVVFLSGDVHYAFSSDNYHRPDPASETWHRFIQFCASSAKNANPGGVALGKIATVQKAMGSYHWTDLKTFSEGVTPQIGADEMERNASIWSRLRTYTSSLIVEDSNRMTGDTVSELSISEEQEEERKSLAYRWVGKTCHMLETDKNNPCVKVGGDLLYKIPLIDAQLALLEQSANLETGAAFNKFTFHLMDERGRDRYTHDDRALAYYDSLYVPRVADVLQNLVVGTTNLGLIHFDRAEEGLAPITGFNQTEIHHDLIWYHKPRLDFYETYFNVTRHSVDLSVTPVIPDLISADDLPEEE